VLKRAPLSISLLSLTPQVTELDAQPRSKDSLRKLYKSPLAKLLLFADYSGGEVEELMSQFAVTAKAHKGQLFFVKGLPEPNAGGEGAAQRRRT
jgi:hypothetical protein